MNIDNLYNSYMQKHNTIMQTQSNQTKLDNIKSILEKNSLIFKDAQGSKDGVQVFIVIIAGFIGLVIGAKLFDASQLFTIFLTIGFALVGYIISLLFKSFTTYRVDSSIIYLEHIMKKKWKFYYENPTKIWQEFSQKYPYLNSGDVDNSIGLCIYGEYEKNYFRYFEYDYTIEEEEEVEREDSDGNTYYETEYYEESYTESCLVIDIKNSLPSITITGRPADSKALKFSYIEFNKALSVYTYYTNEAHTFFDPQTQEIFLKFYKQFPNSLMSICQDRLYINFSQNLLPYPRQLDFDQNIAASMGNKDLANDVEKLLHLTSPLIEKTTSFKTETN